MRASVKAAVITQLKCVVVSAFVSLAFVSQASAVLRPLFPIKPAAPFNGKVFITGDELVLPSAKSLCCLTEPAKAASAWTAIAPAFGGGSFVLDIAWQRAYERPVVRQIHMSPVPQGEIERKIGQSLARSRLAKLAT